MSFPGPVDPAALQAAREALAAAGLMSTDPPAGAAPDDDRPLSPRLGASRRGPRTISLELSPRAGRRLVLEWTEHRGEDLPSFARGPRFTASYSHKPGAWDVDAPDTPEELRSLAFEACRALAAWEAEVSLAPVAPPPAAPPGAAREDAEDAEDGGPAPASDANTSDEEARIDALVRELDEALRADLGSARFPGSQGWELVRARAFTFWRRVADIKLSQGDRTLSFIVFPTDPNERVYARTDRLDVVYYSDDLPPSRHDELFERDAAMIDAFVAWISAR